MKVYKVKVNGKVYEVEIEAVDEVNDSIKTEAVAAAPVRENKPVSEGDRRCSNYRQGTGDQGQGWRRCKEGPDRGSY